MRSMMESRGEAAKMNPSDRSTTTASATRGYPPPGALIPVNGHRLHLICQGEGGPAVIMETGGPGIPLGWTLIQPEVARFTRACSYDRAGIGWSDPGPQPRSGRTIVAELRTVLQRGGIEPPYVLVAASFGGHYVRLYASQYPEEVAGLVFVDCSHEDMVASFPPAMRRVFHLSRYAIGLFAILARLGVTRLAGARLPIVSQLLHEEVPEELRRQLLWHFARPEQWQGMHAEVKGYQEIEAEVRASRAARPSFGSIPLVVLTAQATWDDPKLLPPGVKPGEIRPIWLKLQQDLASLSSQSRHVVFDDLSHTMMLSPAGAQRVVAEIRQIVEAARS